MLTAQESTDGIDMDTVPPRTFARRILALNPFLRPHCKVGIVF